MAIWVNIGCSVEEAINNFKLNILYEFTLVEKRKPKTSKFYMVVYQRI